MKKLMASILSVLLAVGLFAGCAQKKVDIKKDCLMEFDWGCTVEEALDKLGFAGMTAANEVSDDAGTMFTYDISGKTDGFSELILLVSTHGGVNYGVCGAAFTSEDDAVLQAMYDNAKNCKNAYVCADGRIGEGKWTDARYAALPTDMTRPEHDEAILQEEYPLTSCVLTDGGIQFAGFWQVVTE